MSMAQGKEPGNDGLTKEFCNQFWEELKELFVVSVRATKLKLKTQTVIHFIAKTSYLIKLIHKKDRDKNFI